MAETKTAYPPAVPVELHPEIQEMNAREQLAAAGQWLGYIHEDLSFGLKTPEDGLKLWRYNFSRDTDELPDEWDGAELVHVLGYNPMVRAYETDGVHGPEDDGRDEPPVPVADRMGEALLADMLAALRAIAKQAADPLSRHRALAAIAKAEGRTNG